jgi:hypothetical protein
VVGSTPPDRPRRKTKMGREAAGVAIRLSIGLGRVRSPYVPPKGAFTHPQGRICAHHLLWGSEAFMAKHLVEAQETVVRVHPNPLHGEASRLATAPGLNPDEPKWPWGFDSLPLRHAAPSRMSAKEYGEVGTLASPPGRNPGVRQNAALQVRLLSSPRFDGRVRTLASQHGPNPCVRPGRTGSSTLPPSAFGAVFQRENG